MYLTKPIFHLFQFNQFCFYFLCSIKCTLHNSTFAVFTQKNNNTFIFSCFILLIKYQDYFNSSNLCLFKQHCVFFLLCYATFSMSFFIASFLLLHLIVFPISEIVFYLMFAKCHRMQHVTKNTKMFAQLIAIFFAILCLLSQWCLSKGVKSGKEIFYFSNYRRLNKYK